MCRVSRDGISIPQIMSHCPLPCFADNGSEPNLHMGGAEAGVSSHQVGVTSPAYVHFRNFIVQTLCASSSEHQLLLQSAAANLLPSSQQIQESRFQHSRSQFWGYGSTECSPSAPTGNKEMPVSLGSSGIIIPHIAPASRPAGSRS
jgi:hypothetical protein